MGEWPMASLPRITPHLWFDKEAKEAAAFYCSVFPGSKITHLSTVRGVPTPTGECDIVSFDLSGQPFMAISAGPMFKFKDRFGLSWQVWPRAIGEMMENGTPEQVARVTKAMLPMKKLDIAALEKAYKG